MKTAKEWAADKTVYLTTEHCIKAIQADAYRAGLLRAAQVCKELGRRDYVSSDTAAEAIEAEAQKGLS